MARVLCYLNSTQAAFYFPNHMIVTQGNTCTYQNGLTNILKGVLVMQKH